MPLPRIVLLLALALAAPAAAEVAGRVVDEDRRPVAEARVELVAAAGGGAAAVAWTDAGGAFAFPAAAPPAEVRVSHPGFLPGRFAVAAGGGPLVLAVRREVSDAIEVSAELGRGVAVPPTLSIATVDPAAQAAPPAALTAALATVPGLAESGQGGAFQVFSIRGLSGQRVLTRVAGAPLFGERRAGVETSFVEPLLVGAAQVVRGPSSTFQGAGALGGVVEVFARRRAGWSAEAGWASQGSERSAAIGWGGEGWSLAAAWRDAGDAETADGEPLFSRFSRLAASVERRWPAAGADWSLVLLPAAVRDVGKPNVDVPRRTTLYPDEDHLVASLTALWPGGWSGNAWLHPHAVDTRTTGRDGSRALVENDAADGGLRLEREGRLSDGLALRAGGEAVVRHGVDAVETAFDPAGRRLAVARPLDDAAQEELSAFASLAWTLPGATVAAGGRWTHLAQDNRAPGAAGLDDGAWNGFAGVVVPLGGGLRATANLGTGMRWPTLSERFFTGTTGRGEVVANPGLGPERSLQGDLGLAWSGRRAHLAVHLFRSEIEGFIEQVELPAGEPGVERSTFVNLGEGRLTGVEAEAVAELAPGWTLAAGGHAVEGENEAGGALSDVPADRLSATLSAGPGARLAGGRLTARLRLERRDAIDRPGPGERAIPGATLLSAGLGWSLRPGLVVTLSGSNLTDELWLPAADDKAVPAAGRSVGVSLRWER